jgi:hypothetical protein
MFKRNSPCQAGFPGGDGEKCFHENSPFLSEKDSRLSGPLAEPA